MLYYKPAFANSHSQAHGKEVKASTSPTLFEQPGENHCAICRRRIRRYGPVAQILSIFGCISSPVDTVLRKKLL